MPANPTPFSRRIREGKVRIRAESPVKYDAHLSESIFQILFGIQKRNRCAMLKESILSVRKDLDRAVCYMLVFMLSSMFMYLFFHVSLSETVGVTYIYGKNDLPTFLTTFDVLVCILVIFMANDFYVKKKSNELAVILMCGGTYLQLMQFLIFQTGILMAVSIPVGVAAGRLCFPLLAAVFRCMTGQELSMASGSQPVILSASIIGFEVFWCTFVNLGYSYRNSIYTLLHGEKKIRMEFPKLLAAKSLRYIYPGLYLGGAGLLYFCGREPEQITMLGIAGLLGLCGTIDKVVLPWLERGGAQRWADDGEKLVYMGLFREDLKMAKLYIVLFIAAADILCCLTAGMIEKGSEFALCLLSFSSMIPLLGISLMFRVASEAAGRKKQFAALRKIGYAREQIVHIVGRELLWLYGVIMGASLVYILNIAAVLCIYGMIPVAAGIWLVVIFVVSLALCGYVNYRYNCADEAG